MDDIGEFLTEESLSWLLQKYGKAVTCVCFMGGDAYPLEVERLAQFLCCRQSIAPVKVGWYSGKSELPADFNMSYFEYIKLGPYVEALGGLKSAKTNQRLYRIANGKMEDITYRFLSNQLFV
jgi:anaerobic ribonucleoside-triphosphate reductase activating protein